MGTHTIRTGTAILTTVAVMAFGWPAVAAAAPGRAAGQRSASASAPSKPAAEVPAVGGQFRFSTQTEATNSGPAASSGIARSAFSAGSSTASAGAPQGLFVAPEPVPQLATLTGTNGGVVSIASGEFSASGHQDVAALICNPCGAWGQPPFRPSTDGTYSIAVLPGNGDGTFGNPTQLSPVGPNIALSMIAAADLGNGHTDLIVSEIGRTDANPYQLLAYLGNGDGTFQSTPTTVNSPGPIVRFQVADLGNGHPDLVAMVTGGAQGNAVVVFTGDGTGHFTAGTPMPLCPASAPPGSCPSTDSLTDLVVAPLRTGGKPDILVSQHSGFVLNNGYQNSTDTLAVLMNNGDGTFASPAYPVTEMNVVTGIEVGDFTGPAGPPDVLLAGTCLSNQIGTLPQNCQMLLHGNGDGTFQTPTVSDAALVQSNSMRAAVADTPVVLTSGGPLDSLWIATYGNQQSSAIEAMINNGSGSFTPEEMVGVLPGAVYASTAQPVDLSGDGQPDLVVGGGPVGGFSSSPGLWVVPANTKDPGTFLTARGYLGFPGRLYDQSVAVGDFRSSGHQDVLDATVGAGGKADITLLPGNGDGTFGTAQDGSYASATGSVFPRWGLVSQDFNGDGKLDIAYLDAGGELDYQLGNGDGTFGPVVQVPANLSVPLGTSVDLIETTLNGEPDIIASVPNGSANPLESWLWSPATSSFGAAVVSHGLPAVQSGYGDIAVGHFKAGDPVDLAIVIQPSGGVPEIDVVTGNSDGTFNTASPTKVATPCSTATGGSNNFSYGAIAVGNLGNGHDDIVWQCISVLYVAMGNGDGTFQSAQSYPEPPGAASAPPGNQAHLMLSDLEGNGHLDAVAYGGDYNVPTGMAVWHNNGDGTFAAAELYTLGIQTNNNLGKMVTAAPLTTSGTEDLLVLGDAGDGNDDLTIFFSTGGRPALEATQVSAPTPSSPAPGDMVSGSYQVTDTGGPVSSSWVDSVYMAPGATGTTWSDADTLLERVPQSQTLGGGGSYTGQYSFPLGDVPAGTHHLIVVPDSSDVLSGGNEVPAASPSFTVGPIPTLSVGSPVATTIQAGQDLYYQLSVAAGTDVQVAITGLPQGDLSLLGQNGQVPTAQSATVGSTSNTVTVPGSSPGTWFLVIQPSQAVGSTAAPITITASDLGMTIDSISPPTHAIPIPPPVTGCVTSIFGGNKVTLCPPPPPPPPVGDGLMTLTLQGSGFGSDLSVQLVDGPTTYTSTMVTRRDSTVAFASFPVESFFTQFSPPGLVAPGIYDVVISSGGHQATLAKGFTVATVKSPVPPINTLTPIAPLTVSFSAPAELRLGFVGQLAVSVKNNTSTDIAVPVVDVTSAVAVLGAPGVTDPLDFTSSLELDDPVMSTSPLENPSPPGILGAGQSFAFDLSILSSPGTPAHTPLATTTTLVTSADTTPINWSSLLANGAPSGMTATEWGEVMSRIAATYGATEGSYALHLVPLIAEAQADGVTLQSQDDIVRFLIEKEIRTGGPVHGLVTDIASGDTVPNTAVTFTNPNNPAQTYQTTTWYDGTYSLYELPAGSYNVAVRGYLPGSQQVSVPVSGAVNAPLDVTDGAILTGKVTDSTTGDPIGGASVAVTDPDGTLTTTTGPDGSYRVAGLDEASVSIQVDAVGFVESTPPPVVVTIGAPTTDNVTMDEAGIITGTVTAEGGGAPPSGTAVTAVSTGQPIAGVVQSDGTFTIDGLAPGSYSLTATGPNAGAVTTTGITVTSGQTTSVGTLALAPPATLTGTVTDTVTDTPIAGAMVLSEAVGAPPFVTTASDGSYTITGLPGGSQQILVLPPDASHSMGQTTIGLTGGATTNADVGLDPTGTVVATVEDSTGRALPNTLVDLVGPSAATGSDGQQPLQSDVSGQVTASGLVDGSYDLQVVGSDVHSKFTISNANLFPVLTLQVPVSVVTGQVVDSSNNPIAGTAVNLVDSTGVVDTTTTDASGDYSFDTVGLANADIVVSSPAAGVLIAQGVSVSSGGTTTAPTLQAGTASLDLTVTDSNGPVSGAIVSLFRGSPADSAAANVANTTDGSGAAIFANLTPGLYKVDVANGTDASTVQALTIGAGSNSQIVALAQAGSISGTVTAGAKSVSGADIVAYPSGTDVPAGAATTASDGTYSLSGLAAGSYDLSVSASGGAPVVHTGVAVTAGAVASADVSMPTTGDVLTVSLTPDVAGGPLAQTQLSVLDANGTAVASTQLGPSVSNSDPGASATIGPLTDGSYTLRISGPGRATSTQAVTEASGGTSVSIDASTPEALPDEAPGVVDGVFGAGAAQTSAGGVASPKEPVSIAQSLVQVAAQRSASTAAGSGASTTLSIGDLLHAWTSGNVIAPPTFNDVSDLVLAEQAAMSAINNYTANDCDGAELAALKAQLQRYVRTANIFLQQWAENASEVQSLLASDGPFLAAQALGAFGALVTGLMGLPFIVGDAVVVGAGANPALLAALAAVNGFKSGQGVAKTIISDLQSANFSDAVARANDLKSAVTVIKNFLVNDFEAGAKTALSGVSVALGAVVDAINIFQGMAQTGAKLEQVAQEGRNDRAEYEHALSTVNSLIAQIAALASTPCPPNPPPPDPPPPDPNQPYTNRFNQPSGVGPGDPNEILGLTGDGSAGKYINPGTTLPYTIFFKNEPTASAPATKVVVTIPLPAGTDPSTLQLTGFGFGQTSVPVSGGVTSFSQMLTGLNLANGDDVSASGSYDPASNRITWTLEGINPATGDIDGTPQGGFLPPDDAAGDGEGFVSFQVDPRANLANGTKISAQASIVFDTNAAMATNTWVNTMDTTAPTATVAALPATEPGPFTVSWSGRTTASPIATYNVYVSTDSKAWQLWQSGVKTTSARYPGQIGHLYQFAATATNLLGNTGPIPVTSQAHTFVPTPPKTPPVLGYRMVASDGGIFNFGKGVGFYGSTGAIHLPTPIVGMANTPDGKGYWLAEANGTVFAFGDAHNYGHASTTGIVGISPTFDGKGYWLVTAGGRIFAFGDAHNYGSVVGALTKPVVGMAATPDGKGYWLTATDGGIFTFGDAKYLGSTGGVRLNKPVVGMAPTPDGKGYWLVATDGGIFTFGDARFFGSTGAIRLNKPIDGMAATPDGKGYWLVASDGGIFTFGDARFFGSTGAIRLAKPIVGLSPVL